MRKECNNLIHCIVFSLEEPKKTMKDIGITGLRSKICTPDLSNAKHYQYSPDSQVLYLYVKNYNYVTEAMIEYICIHVQGVYHSRHCAHKLSYYVVQ
jgi:hypothetical protein